MTELPFEILRRISQFVCKHDLLQLQLVNKRWREASSESLYSDVTIYGGRDALLYIHTISNNRKFASYLTFIEVFGLFNMYHESQIWDENNLLDTLVKYCHNLRSVQTYDPHQLLWTRLMHAAIQGQLPKLQILPPDNDGDLELYVCTALAFRKSLTTLNLRDYVKSSNTSSLILNIRAFQELRGSIKEFLHLQSLSIKRYSNQPFSHIVDQLIDDCPQLIELNVKIKYNNDLQAAKRQDLLAVPKPNIRRLTCMWSVICKDDQLKYTMRKFPNLQYLYMQRDYRLESMTGKLQNNDFSPGVMVEFIKYISNVKEISINFNCKRRDMVNYWSEFKKLRKCEASEKLVIGYHVDKDEDNSIVSLSFSDKILALLYNISNTDEFMPQEEFLREHGDIIKHLTIDSTSYVHNLLDRTSSLWFALSSEEWIYQILQLCPSLQKLKFRGGLVELKLPYNSTYQHTELKKLTIKDQSVTSSLKFLRGFSFHAPNLKKLKMCNICEDNDIGYCVEIDMPYTMFDIIFMEFGKYNNEIEDYFIKLNTIEDENYYLITSNGRRNLTKNEYQNSNKRCLFEITCRSLKQFELTRMGADNINRQQF